MTLRPLSPPAVLPAATPAAASLLLADLLPEQRERVLELGNHGGAHRVMCGVHHPSDVLVPQRFARGASSRIIVTPQWQRFRSDG